MKTYTEAVDDLVGAAQETIDAINDAIPMRWFWFGAARLVDWTQTGIEWLINHWLTAAIIMFFAGLVIVIAAALSGCGPIPCPGCEDPALLQTVGALQTAVYSETPSPTASPSLTPSPAIIEVSATPAPPSETPQPTLTIIETPPASPTPQFRSGPGTFVYTVATNIRNCMPYEIPSVDDWWAWFGALHPLTDCQMSSGMIVNPGHFLRVLTFARNGNDIWLWISPNPDYVALVCYNQQSRGNYYPGWSPPAQAAILQPDDYATAPEPIKGCDIP